MIFPNLADIPGPRAEQLNNHARNDSKYMRMIEATHGPYSFFLSIRLSYSANFGSNTSHQASLPSLCRSLESSCLPALSKNIMLRRAPIPFSRWWNVFLQATSVEDVSVVSRVEIVAK